MYSHISTETWLKLAVDPIDPETRSLFETSRPLNTTATGPVVVFFMPPIDVVPSPKVYEPVFVQVGESSE